MTDGDIKNSGEISGGDGGGVQPGDQGGAGESLKAASGPRVAVIVPNFNGSSYLGECLPSLLDQSYTNYSVTVVDNASSDDSVDVMRRDFPQVELLANSVNSGFAGGCNTGLKHALAGEAEYFVLVNSDTIADRDWLAELVEVAQSDPRIGVCQSMIYLADRPAMINSAGNEAHYLAFGYCGHYLEEDHGQFTAAVDVPFASGTSLLVKRAVIDEIGLMDEDLFLYQEDLDLSWRARLAGWRVVLAPASKIYHKYSFSRNQMKFYYLERNRLLLLLQNYSPRSLAVLAPAFLGAEVAMIGYSLTGGWFKQKMRGYAWIAGHMGMVRDKRRRVQGQRHVSDAELTSFWTDKMGFADLQDSPLTKIANPVSAAYWKIARKLL
ncbi:MAG: glycosyltransferase family 2 protein [Thermoleophilia bacterium]